MAVLLLLSCEQGPKAGVGRPRLPAAIETGTVRVGGDPVRLRLELGNEAADVALRVVTARIEGDDRGAYALEPPVDGVPWAWTLVHRAAATAGDDEARLVVELESADPPQLSTRLLGQTVEACPSGTSDCGGTCVDLQRDSAHCGTCETVCPAGLNAPAACRAGTCGRGRCEKPWFDLDGPATFGCEATCDGRVCTADGGAGPKLHAPPIPEWALRVDTLASSGVTQAGATYRNIATLGEPSAPPPGNTVLTSPGFTLIGGFHAAHELP